MSPNQAGSPDPLVPGPSLSRHREDGKDATVKFAYIDVLRGIAILGVIAVHAARMIDGMAWQVDWIFNYGQLGVQLFFVASAMTLCLSMAQRREETPRNFYLRRFFRIAPLYYLGLPLYFLWETARGYHMAGVLQVPPQYHDYASIATNVFFVHTFYPPAFRPALVPGGWSISTEMLFYLVFPALFALQSRMDDARYLRFVGAAVAACFAADLLVAQAIGVTPDKDFFFYGNLVNQFPVFLIGILAYRLLPRFRGGPAWNALATVLVPASVVLLDVNLANKTGFNGFVFPILSAIAFGILALRMSRLQLAGPLSIALRELGKVSYSVYLLHFLVLDMLFFALGRSVFRLVGSPEARLAILYGAAILASYLAARVSHRWIETPGIRFGRRFLRHNADRRSPAAEPARP